MAIRIARVYEPAKRPGEYRVLVDRLWPRGISKQKAALDSWAKEVAPSTELRKWFNHDPERLAEFSARYMRELDNNPAAPEFITQLKDHANVTLLYGAKDPRVNHAVVLRKYVLQKIK